MKRLMTAAMALTLMSGTSALAQQNDQHHGGGGGHPGGGATHAAATGGGGGHPGGGGGGHPGGGGGGAGHPGGGAPSGGFHAVAQGVVSHAGAPSGFTPGPHQGGTQGNVHAYSSGGVHGGGAPVGPGGGQPGFQGRSGPAGRSSGVSGPQAGAHAGFTGGARGRFDPGRFPRVIQPSRQFQWRGRAWVGQPGYYSRHWGYGERLPFGWFSSRWYITDYYDYDLPAPPYDYMWVRVGPDALLVNIYTGEVVEAEYGVFY